MPEGELTAAAQQTLAQWHRMVAGTDLAAVGTLLHPDIVFRSPVVFKAYAGVDATSLILDTVSKVFGNFRYHREFVSGDGASVCLEFTAEAGDKSLKGVDLVRFADDGRIVEFEVMVRPMSGLQALAAEMLRRLPEN